MISEPSGDATTTLYLEATQSSQYPLGVLTSIVDTFINDGTTTEYMTQHVGTEIDSMYAKIATTSSREYYRIAPTASQDYNSPARPTGLIGSSTSLDIHGPESTYYTVEEYRTYLDGHYAHLVSSISNVVTDAEAIQPTPRFELDGALNSDSLFSSYGVESGVRIKTIGAIEAKLEEAVEELENEIEDFSESVSGSVKRPRQIDLDDLIAIESENLEIEASPVSSTQSLPTFTVGSNGELNFPTPSVEAVEPIVEKDPIERQHRFLAVKETKSALDTVTYVGFVDFTTTIDDTVVIFSPKNNYNTKTSNAFPSRIEPTRAFTAIGEPTLAETTPQIAVRGEIINEEIDFEDTDEDSRKPQSGIDALKSLLASSAAQRTSIRGASLRSRFSSSPFSSSVSPTASFPSNVASDAPELESGNDLLIDLVPSIESDVELVFKTLFTTYTYATTYITINTTRVKSREETISNVITLTNILKPTDLPAISSSCQLDSGCLFASTDILDNFSEGFIGRPNFKSIEEPRSDGGRQVATQLEEGLEVDAVLNTVYTTYTFFETQTESGIETTSTRTEVYSNIHTSEVPNFSLAESILPTSTLNINLDLETSTSAPRAEGRSIFPVRRLEVSSFRNMQLQSDLTTPETITTTGSDEITTAEQVAEIASTRATSEIEDEEFLISTDETPALTEEITEVSSTAITESAEELNPEAVEKVYRTLFTTLSYMTTLFSDNTTSVTTNFETITNVITDGIQPTLVQPTDVTFFTTFTYWTTYIDEFNNNSSLVVSSEETITDVVPNTFLALGASGIEATPTTKTVIEQTEFALPVLSLEAADVSESDLTSTFPPNLQSSEEEEDPKLADVATESIESSLSFEDIDNDLILTTEPDAVTETAEEAKDEDTEKNNIVRPSRGRGRISISRPGNTFTPVIRPLLGNRKPARFFRPSNLVASTTVATRTRNSVKPTLIATPASSAILNTPIFESSSRILASASIFNRGASRSFASPSFQPSAGFASSINPTSVIDDRGSATFSTSSQGELTPSVVISPLRLRRPNPFRARLKELQLEKIEKIRKGNDNSLNADDDKNDDDDINSLPIPNFPSIPGGNAPIFISSQRQKITRNPGVTAESKIEIPDDIAARRERAREKIKSLFSRRQPFQQSRRKRQVAFGAEFGSRTSQILRRSQSFPQSYPQDNPSYSAYGQPYNPQYNPPFTAFSNSYDNRNNNDAIYSSSSENSKTSNTFRRQVPEAPPSSSRSRSRSRSRFSESQASSSSPPTSATTSRSRTRFRNFRVQSTEPTTTPEPVSSRFRPRGQSSDSRSINSFSSTRNQNRFSLDTRTSSREPSTRSRFSNPTSSRNSLFTRGKVVDYGEYDYYDYEDTDIQSSDSSIPDFITVTHQVPVATRIPVVEFGQTEFRDILSTSPSLEVLAVTALKSTDVNNSPVIYAKAITATPKPGVKEVLFDALRATETTSISFTPTKIRGRRTSFSQIVPSTIYNVETITTQIVEPIDQNQLLNSLLQHLLLGQTPLQQTTAPIIPPPQVVTQTPGTQLITHTSTYITTITEESSRILPITLRGRAIKTTIVESSSKVVTATEFSTETIVHSAIAPTQALQPIAATEAPDINVQLASLLPALLGSNLFNSKPTAQEQALEQQKQALLAAQLQEQQEQLARQEQEQLNEELLAQINLDDFTDEDLANLDIDAVLEAVANKNPGILFPDKNLLETVKPTPVVPSGPKSTLVTIFKSGETPGEFTSLVSTVFLEERRIRREIKPAQATQIIETTQIPDLIRGQDESNVIETLGGQRGPVHIQLYSGETYIESSLVEPSSSLKTQSLYIP